MNDMERLEWKIGKLELYMHNARVTLENFKLTPEEKVKLALIWLAPIEEDK